MGLSRRLREEGASRGYFAGLARQTQVVSGADRSRRLISAWIVAYSFHPGRMGAVRAAGASSRRWSWSVVPSWRRWKSSAGSYFASTRPSAHAARPAPPAKGLYLTRPSLTVSDRPGLASQAPLVARGTIIPDRVEYIAGTRSSASLECVSGFGRHETNCP